MDSIVRAAALIAVLGQLIPAATAQGGLTPEAAVNLRRVADVHLSPNGDNIVYRIDRPRGDGEPRGWGVGELWLVTSTGGAPALLANSGFNAHEPRWSPDGRKLAWIAQRGSAVRA